MSESDKEPDETDNIKVECCGKTWCVCWEWCTPLLKAARIIFLVLVPFVVTFALHIYNFVANFLYFNDVSFDFEPLNGSNASHGLLINNKFEHNYTYIDAINITRQPDFNRSMCTVFTRKEFKRLGHIYHGPINVLIKGIYFVYMSLALVWACVHMVLKIRAILLDQDVDDDKSEKKEIEEEEKDMRKKEAKELKEQRKYRFKALRTQEENEQDEEEHRSVKRKCIWCCANCLACKFLVCKFFYKCCCRPVGRCCRIFFSFDLESNLSRIIKIFYFPTVFVITVVDYKLPCLHLSSGKQFLEVALVSTVCMLVLMALLIAYMAVLGTCLFKSSKDEFQNGSFLKRGISAVGVYFTAAVAFLIILYFIVCLVIYLALFLGPQPARIQNLMFTLVFLLENFFRNACRRCRTFFRCFYFLLFCQPSHR